MTKITLFIFVFFVCHSITAQKVNINKESEKVKGESVNGFMTELEGKKDDVSPSWIKFLKEIGKVKQGSSITISEPVFNSLVFSKGIIYAQVTDKGEKTRVWLGIKPQEWDTNDVDRINHELEKAVYRFGVKYYRDKIQVDIDQSQDALDAVTKQQQRLSNQAKDLTISLSNNEQDRLALEKSLESNKFENAVLKVKLDNNKKALDSLAQAGMQIEKVKQMHVERQRKVN